jgi:hypothetical protein
MRENEWDAAHIAYVTGVAQSDGTRCYPSMSEIAREYGISKSAVTHRAADERWFEDRENFRRKVYEAAVRSYEDQFSRLLARADMDATIAAADLIAHIRRMVAHATDTERTTLAKNIAKPLRELLSVVHQAVGIEQAVELEKTESEAA